MQVVINDIRFARFNVVVDHLRNRGVAAGTAYPEPRIVACSYARPAMRLGTCLPRTAYSRARWLDRASSTIMLIPTVGRLVASVTTSDRFALPTNAPMVVNTHDNMSTRRAQLRPANTASARPISTRQ